MKSNSVLIVGCGDLGIAPGACCWPQAGRWLVCVATYKRCRRVYRLCGGLYSARQPGFYRDLTTGLCAGHLQSQRALSGGLSRRLCDGHGKSAGGPWRAPPAAHSLGFQHACVGRAEQVAGWMRTAPWPDRGSPGNGDNRGGATLAGSRQAASVVRFAGIYGYPGGRLLSRIGSGELCAAQPPRYSNRIHRDDCAGFLAHSAACGCRRGHWRRCISAWMISQRCSLRWSPGWQRDWE